MPPFNTITSLTAELAGYQVQSASLVNWLPRPYNQYEWRTAGRFGELRKHESSRGIDYHSIRSSLASAAKRAIDHRRSCAPMDYWKPANSWQTQNRVFLLSSLS